jgi:hypothetical protein
MKIDESVPPCYAFVTSLKSTTMAKTGGQCPERVARESRFQSQQELESSTFNSKSQHQAIPALFPF